MRSMPAVRLFLGGDVMTGRGIDQILGTPSPPTIHEPFIRDAREYVHLAERANGPIPRPVSDAYIWGDVPEELDRFAPHARIVNLETSVTTSDAAWPKGINYRMNPANVGCLTAAKLDVCALANNHALDYGEAGLLVSLASLAGKGLQTVGAGRDRDEARRPARLRLPGGADLLVFAFGSETSGVPARWAAATDRPGVAFLGDLSQATAGDILHVMARAKGPGDILVASLHWGTNWGHAVPPDHVRFAHWLVDGGVDVIHGHSSHHPRPIEVYRNRLILYGCGNFIDDYEGIGGYEEFRSDLVLMHLASLDPTGQLVSLRMRPLQIRRMRLHRAAAADAQWMAEVLTRISARFGSRIQVVPDGALQLLQ
jgi:poly-gamma-glutamate capsule biosynthesis protein CapA/YwtB (metallophosphatase superfamily)